MSNTVERSTSTKKTNQEWNHNHTAKALTLFNDFTTKLYGGEIRAVGSHYML